MTRRALDRWARDEEAPAILKRRRASMRRQQRHLFDGRMAHRQAERYMRRCEP